MNKMKSLISFLLLSFMFVTNNVSAGGKDAPATIYGFKVDALEGGTIDFSKYKGKKILVVNTASECGYTPQYEGLEALYKENKGKLIIIGFPANNFGAQEPGNNAAIAGFCKKNYGVTFPMAAKISVKGDDKAAIYKWLTEKISNGVMDSDVKWNFQKYLIDEEGHLVAMFPSAVKPEGPEIKAALAK